MIAILETTHETNIAARRADLGLSGALSQGIAGLSRGDRGRHGVRFRAAAVRSRDRRDQAGAVRTAGRAWPGADEALSRGRGLVARRRVEVQCLLRSGRRALSDFQRDL